MNFNELSDRLGLKSNWFGKDYNVSGEPISLEQIKQATDNILRPTGGKVYALHISPQIIEEARRLEIWMQQAEYAKKYLYPTYSDPIDPFLVKKKSKDVDLRDIFLPEVFPERHRV